MDNRRIHEAMLGLWIVRPMRQTGVDAVLPAPGGVVDAQLFGFLIALKTTDRTYYRKRGEKNVNCLTCTFL